MIIADYMSKFGTGNASSFTQTVQPWVRSLLDGAFGTHTVDRFASRNNVQVSPPRTILFSLDLKQILSRMAGRIFLSLGLGSKETSRK